MKSFAKDSHRKHNYLLNVFIRTIVLITVKISIIIPTYKPDSYLWQCLDSACSQSFSHLDYEIIIILNGCKEPWYEAINNYIKKTNSDVSISLIQTDITGVSNARNIGIEKSRGDYIAFIDDDDYISSEYLQELYLKADMNIVSLSDTLAFSSTQPPFRYLISDTYSRIQNKTCSSINKARSYFSGPCMKLISRKIIADRRFNARLSNGEDTLFMFEISDKIEKVRSASKSAIYYRRIRDNSATTKKRTNSEKRRSDIIQIKEILRCYCSKPFSYNFVFFLTRLMGGIYYIIRPA